MDKKITPLPIKVLVNAEAFGFGPTAAIADLFPYFRETFSHLSYVGSGHTLDLQRAFNYDEIIDLSGMAPDAFNQVVKEYDLFFTALNFEKAGRAADLKIPTIIYDPLTWFWPKIPPVVAREGVLYLAQKFHGVKERLEKEKKCFNQVMEVDAFTKIVAREKDPQVLLLNMGGLINPFWPIDYYRKYVHAIIQAVKNTADPRLDIKIVCSNQIVQLLPHENICTYSRDEMFSLLPKVKIAIQTPGLANIYEAASHGIPCLFIPPVNDSQGQQLDLIRDHGQVDAFLDWEQLGEKIDYKMGQRIVLEEIGQQINKLSEKETSDRLNVLMKEGLDQLTKKTSLNLTSLLDMFGSEGAQQVAEIVKIKSKEMDATYV